RLLDCREQPLHIRGVGSPHIYAGLGVAGDDVGARATGDGADDESHASLQVGEGGERDDLAAEGKYGTASLLRLDASVRRAALHLQPEGAAALALADYVAVLAPRLQHQDSVRARGHLLKEGATAGCAHLLVGGADEADPAIVVEGERAEGFDGVD